MNPGVPCGNVMLVSNESYSDIECITGKPPLEPADYYPGMITINDSTDAMML